MDTIKTLETTRIIDYRVLKISSSTFQQNEPIPKKHTCDGQNINPPLHIEGITEEAKSLAIIVDDPDAPGGDFCHWVSWNIPVTHQIKERENRGQTGVNDFGRNRYDGPCPPLGIHRYRFKVYTLDCILNLSANSEKSQLQKAMSDHIIGFGELSGKYKRQDPSTR